MSKKVKIFGIIVVALAVIIFVGSRLGSKKLPATTKNSPLSSTTGVVPLPGGPIGATAGNSDEFSNLLSSIKRISIDTSLFDNPAYKMLRDFPVSLGSDVVGRVNPFAPIGTDSGGAPVQKVVVQTLQSGKVTSSTAEFGAQITLADAVPTSVVFEYGTTDTFGSVTTPVTISKSGTTLVTVTKLTPETTYYVRAIALQGAITTTGETTSFITTKK